jgi:uncharacterized damage-inducible protein DinB
VVSLDLRLLVRHMEWADRRLLEAVLPLPDEAWGRPLPSSYGSLAGTVEHLFAAEWTWLRRLSGDSPRTVGPQSGARDRSRLAVLWPEVWAGWRQAATREPREPVRYATTAGVQHVNTVGEVCLHVALHSAAYRGQAAALMRQMGRTPPATDLITWLREGNPPDQATGATEVRH